MDRARPRLGSLRAAELVASLSLATDIGTGFPWEHALRTCLLAVWTGEACGFAGQELQDIYYVALLKYLGCTTTAHVSAHVLGNEFGMGTWFATTDLGDQNEVMSALQSNLGTDLPEADRQMLLDRLMQSPMLLAENMTEHCELGRLLAAELGLSRAVADSLGQAFARWDGSGVPFGLAGEAITVPMRIAVIVEEAERYARARGAVATVEMVRERSGRAYDPQLAAVFCSRGEELLTRLDTLDCWGAVLALEPEPFRWLGAEALERALVAVADFTDMKSPFLVGHSRAVADLGARAAEVEGLAEAECLELRHAGWVHDLGRVAVSSAIWAKPGPLTAGEVDRVRLHPHYTDRILARSSQLGGLRTIAALHHERMDSSGYHRGLPASSQPAQARILAAADVFTALREERPHRAAHSAEAAAKVLEDEVRAGRLEGKTAHAVLTAAGQRPRGSRPRLPADLTSRELEVLRGLARGRTTKQVAGELFVSPKTADNHVQHIYQKLGVSTRAGSHGLRAPTRVARSELTKMRRTPHALTMLPP